MPLDHGFYILQNRQNDRLQKDFFIGKIMIDVAKRGIRFLRNHPHRGIFIASFYELVRRDLKDGLSHLLFLHLHPLTSLHPYDRRNRK